MLYYLSATDKSALTDVRPSTLQQLGWDEKDLENLVSKHIDRVVREDQLLVIHQERRYQEEPDILAIDRAGVLHIFELKRWKSSQEKGIALPCSAMMKSPGRHRELDRRHAQHLRPAGPIRTRPAALSGRSKGP
jgi:hypothetical protein